MRISKLHSGLSVLAVVWFFSAQSAHADFTTYHSQPNWLTAAGGAATVFHFDGPTETHGRPANDAAITPSYSSQGVDFLPFTGSQVYPYVARGQAFQIPDANRDGLLANNTSPNPTSDLLGRAIQFNFNIPAKAVGVFTNKSGDGDGGYLAAYDAASNLIGQVDLDAGVFGGIVTNQTIVRVAIVNTFNSDINFGIWDLQFSTVPEPSTSALLAIGAIGMCLLRARRRPS